MQDIFLSYSSKDRDRLVPLAHALEAEGWTVFWDHEAVPIGKQWQQVIGQAIRNSRCVLVVWSKSSVKSEWVLEEAIEGKKRGVLFPVCIDHVDIPFGFGFHQVGDLTDWKGNTTHSEFVRLIDDLRFELDGIRPPSRTKRATVEASGFGTKLRWSLLVLAAVIGVGYWYTQPDPVLEPEPEMVKIPGGTFTMGCLEARDVVKGMNECYSDETPPHQVTVSDFFLAKTEVTVGQFRAFAEAENYQTTAEAKGACWSYDSTGQWDDVKGNSWRKLGFKQNEDHPVACVSWNDAQAYVDWLRKKTGEAYRLPTEAEWEYAARARKNTAYSWGKEIGKANANCRGDLCGDSFEFTAPVASFAENQFGVYDMHGNVWEWVEDSWHNDYKGVPSDGSAWVSGDSSDRVLRGGSWYFNPQYLRSADRYSSTPVNRRSNFGFRIAKGL